MIVENRAIDNDAKDRNGATIRILSTTTTLADNTNKIIAHMAASDLNHADLESLRADVKQEQARLEDEIAEERRQGHSESVILLQQQAAIAAKQAETLRSLDVLSDERLDQQAKVTIQGLEAIKMEWYRVERDAKTQVLRENLSVPAEQRPPLGANADERIRSLEEKQKSHLRARPQEQQVIAQAYDVYREIVGRFNPWEQSPDSDVENAFKRFNAGDYELSDLDTIQTALRGVLQRFELSRGFGEN
jgi:hypothetical protein